MKNLELEVMDLNRKLEEAFIRAEETHEYELTAYLLYKFFKEAVWMRGAWGLTLELS